MDRLSCVRSCSASASAPRIKTHENSAGSSSKPIDKQNEDVVVELVEHRCVRRPPPGREKARYRGTAACPKQTSSTASAASSSTSAPRHDRRSDCPPRLVPPRDAAGDCRGRDRGQFDACRVVDLARGVDGKALELWSPEIIEEALGSDADHVLPSGIRLTDLHIPCRAITSPCSSTLPSAITPPSARHWRGSSMRSPARMRTSCPGRLPASPTRCPGRTASPRNFPADPNRPLVERACASHATLRFDDHAVSRCDSLYDSRCPLIIRDRQYRLVTSAAPLSAASPLSAEVGTVPTGRLISMDLDFDAAATPLRDVSVRGTTVLAMAVFGPLIRDASHVSVLRC